MKTIRRMLSARRRAQGPPVVVVSGLPRSGTSMVMGMLKACSFPTVEDGQRIADPDNPKGYFEDERVKNLGRDPDKSWLRATRGKAIKVISYLLKDLPEENSYKVILLERDLKEVLASQAKMLERRGEANTTSDERMIDSYLSLSIKVRHLLDREAHFDWLKVGYSDVVADPRRQAERIAGFLGGGLDVDAMAASVDPNLYRNRAGRNDSAEA